MASEGKFTAGPWVGDLHNTQKYGGREYAHIYSASKVHIASAIVQAETFVNEEARANVHLIASAPDLLEALQSVIATRGGIMALTATDPRTKRVHAAIAKAAGSSHAE